MTRRALPIRRWWVLFGPADDLVQPAFRGGVSGVGSGGADVALGGGHRFVTQQVHQDVYADICVGQFGDERYLYLFSRKRLLFAVLRGPTREAREGGCVAMAVDTRRPAADTAHMASGFPVSANLVRALGSWR